MADDIQPIETETGAFPFPLKDGPVESHYLTWLRNHSNYMVQGGIADYLRIVAVLVRGIILNFLIMLPYFLIFAAALSLVHLFLSQPQSVTLQFSEDAQPAETFTPIEELKIVVRSNLGEADELTVDFDTTDDNFHASMKTLAARLEVTPGQFDTLWWFFDASRDVNGREVIDRDGEVIGLIKAIDKQNGNAVFFSRDEIRTGFIEEELISRPPLFFSMTVLGIATLLIILYPVAVRMGRVRNFRRALATGQLSSVLRRDRYERMFGTLLLLVLVVAALESFPRLSVFFHSLRQGDVSIAIPTLASMFGGLVVANQALPMLGERVKKVAMVFVGLLGLMIPLVLILFVVEFLVYSDMKGLIAQDAEIYVSAALVVLPIIFAILLFATWVMGLREFSWLGHLKLIFLFASMIVLGVAAVLLADYIHGLFPDNPRYLFIYFVVAAAVEIAVYCWLAVDVNQTSINGLYRDRLASAYLIGVDTGGDIAIEKDLHLQEICNYSAGSTAPYHLINTALNLQATKDINIRDRHSDFFMFSKRFIGGRRTGYCRSENMEAVFPQMDLGTAMAVSAAAASPNMGRGTNRLMVAFLTLLNIRLGFWLPNPDRLEKYLHKALKTQNGDPARHTIDFFDDVFPTELAEVAQRRAQLAPGAPRPIADSTLPTVEHGLVGIGFSGGGIRSATLNLGMAQALHRAGVFDHIDYMSTVSGGGYLGSSISTLMRFKTSPYAMVAGTITRLDPHGKSVLITPNDDTEPPLLQNYSASARFAADVAEGAVVQKGTRLLARAIPEGRARYVSLMDGFSWRVRPSALLREILSKLDETHYWVNLSDGGHIENLASIELLRRRCRVIFIGDAECDRSMHFKGLATLVRYARIDLGIHIDLDVSGLRLKSDNTSNAHLAIGKIRYPADPDHGSGQPETGYLVYFKSSCTGDEDEVIQEYRARKPHFPHESTADQMFDEGQFEAYRALGQHIVETALPGGRGRMSFDDLIGWVESGAAGPARPSRRGSRKTP